MSDKENEDITTVTPPGRRRKRTMMDTPLDVNAVTEHEDNMADNVIELNNTDNNNDDAKNRDSGISNGSPDENVNKPVKFTLDGSISDTNENKCEDDEVKSKTEQKSEQKPPEPPNDIVYDETKPRRLHPKNLKLNVNVQNNNNGNAHALRESISFLISPDITEERISPIRRRSNHFPSAPEIEHDLYPDMVTPDNHQNGACMDHRDVEMIRRSHYDRSPETRRRKCSSPVQRLIVKNGQAAVADAARGRERKCSSEARLINSEQIPTPDFNRQRQRKISSDARLEHRPEEQYVFPVETARKRKVSFDPTTLFNGNRVIPLNDGPKLSFQEEPEYFTEECCHEEESPVSENGARPKIFSPTKMVCSCEEDEGFDQSDKDCSMLEKSNSDVSEEGEEGYASGYDNKAYTADDEDSLPGNRHNQTSSSNLESGAMPMRRLSSTRSQTNSSESPAVISHTTMQTLPKKLSSSSLPSSFGRRISSIDEMGTPKSILKNRPTDGESLASEDSIAGKSFKVRKDSIALFMDHNGSVAMQELRKEYSHRRWKCFGWADIKRVRIF